MIASGSDPALNPPPLDHNPALWNLARLLITLGHYRVANDITTRIQATDSQLDHGQLETRQEASRLFRESRSESYRQPAIDGETIELQNSLWWTNEVSHRKFATYQKLITYAKSGPQVDRGARRRRGLFTRRAVKKGDIVFREVAAVFLPCAGPYEEKTYRRVSMEVTVLLLEMTTRIPSLMAVIAYLYHASYQFPTLPGHEVDSRPVVDRYVLKPPR